MSSRRVLPALGLLLLLVLPGSKFLWFDGLPLSNWPERVALIITIFVVIPRTLRTRLANLLEHRAMHGWGGTFLLVLLIAKLWSYFAFPLGDGFEVCLRSLYAPVESCEKSYEATFLTRDGINALGSISRTEDRIDFGPIDRSRPDTDQDTAGSNWNLPFTNDFPRLSELWLDRLPFRADIGTRIHTERDGYLPIRLVGDLEVSYSKGSRGDLGTTVTRFSSYQDETQYFLAVPEGHGVLRLKYEFKEGPTGPIPDTPPVPAGPYATLSLFETTASTDAAPQELLAPVPRDEPNLPVSIALAALNFALAVSIFGLLLAAISPVTLLLCVALVLASVVSTYLIGRVVAYSSAFGIGLIVVTLLGFYLFSSRLRQHRWVTALSLSFGAALVLVQSTVQRINGLGSLLPWDYVMFRGRDTDWLVYQGYARQILVDQSLRGGESVYYFVPGMRYIAFLQHILLGDSDLIIAVFVLVFLLSSTLLFLGTSRTVRPAVIRILIVAVLVATWLRPLTLELTVSGAAEPTAWTFILLGILPWLSRQTKDVNWLYTSCGASAFAVFLRPNLLFAVSLLLMWIISHSLQMGSGLQKQIRAILMSITILSLAFFHNLHYGESTVPFTLFVDLDRELSITQLLKSPLNTDLREMVVDKLRIALYWGINESTPLIATTFWVTQLCWIVTLFISIRDGSLRQKLLLLATPVIYLLSMLPFRYTTIAQRHFLSLMLFFSLSALCPGPKQSESHRT